MKDAYHYRTIPTNFLKGTFCHGFSVAAFKANKSLGKKLKIIPLFPLYMFSLH